jgi:hypothetical protein
MAEPATLHTEDLVPVRSRVSWGAIFAGAVVALAVYFLFSLLGAAIGLSVYNRVQTDQLNTGGIIWGLLSALIALFLGGWVSSQLAVGENKMEASIYGVLLWGVMFATLMCLTVGGVRLSLNGLMAMSITEDTANRTALQVPSENDLAKAGVANDMTARVQGKLREMANTYEVDPHRAAQAAWWTFGGVLLSMLAAIGGALAGSGPTLLLRRIPVRTTAPGRI